MASGLFTYNVGQQVTFTLPSSYLIGNVSIAHKSIEVDADDGLGFRALNPGGTLSATYSTEGERILKIRFADASGTSVVHYHAVTVENTTSSANDRSRGGLRGEPLTFTQPERCPTCICDDITSNGGSATSNLFNTNFSTLTKNDFSSQAGQVKITDPRLEAPDFTTSPSPEQGLKECRKEFLYQGRETYFLCIKCQILGVVSSAEHWRHSHI